MQRLHDAEAAAREIVARTGGEIRLALPLGLGKPVRLVNALVKLACDDPSIRLAIFTALTLEPPDPGSGMKARFLGPAKDGCLAPIRRCFMPSCCAAMRCPTISR